MDGEEIEMKITETKIKLVDGFPWELHVLFVNKLKYKLKGYLDSSA